MDVFNIEQRRLDTPDCYEDVPYTGLITNSITPMLSIILVSLINKGLVAVVLTC